MQHSQKGSAHVVVTICLVIALIFALGWIFWQNFIHKESTKKETDLIVVDKSKQKTNDVKSTASDSSSSPTYSYVDYRQNKKDVTGIKLESQADVDKLTGASDTLKAYFRDRLTKTYTGMDGKTYSYSFTVDRSYGDYAVGSVPGGYGAWGPKDGKGTITQISTTQQDGFNCDKLSAAKVPEELVDSRCVKTYYNTDGTVKDVKLVAYNN